MRIVSLVPNATEILFAIGAGDLVVGVSHECDYPPEARTRPILTGGALSSGMSASEIDAAVSAQLASGRSLYTLDDRRLAELRPDLLFTQELCPVCAVSTGQVGEAIDLLRPHAPCPDVMSLDPTRLEDVLADILHVGERVGRAEAAKRLVDGLRGRLDALESAGRGRPRPAVVALEWLDPPFLGGHWVPQMIALAGGRDPFAVAPGERSRRATWEEIAAAEPDWLVAMPCGFDAAAAQRELDKVLDRPEVRAVRAVREGRVVPVDANGEWSRPGPRLVDGVERLAAVLRSAAG